MASITASLEIASAQQETVARALVDASIATAAQSCMMSSPCLEQGCLTGFASVLDPTSVCSSFASDPTPFLNEDASDGESMGTIALLLDTPLDTSLDAHVCTALNGDAVFTECILTSPLDALLKSMIDHSDGECEDFVEAVLLSAANSSDYNSSATSTPSAAPAAAFVPTAQVSATQAAIINAAVESLLNITGQSATVVAALEEIGGEGIDLADLLASLLGFQAEVDFMSLGDLCSAVHAENSGIAADINATNATAFGGTILASFNDITDEEINAQIASMYGSEDSNATGAVFLRTFRSEVGKCAGLRGAAHFYLYAVSNFQFATASQSETEFVMAAMYTAGCALYMNDATANASPASVSKQSCYILSLMQSYPEILQGDMMTEDTLFAFEDSINNAETRCTAAGVTLQAAVGTRVPTPLPTVATINGAGSLIPQVSLITFSLFSMFF